MDKNRLAVDEWEARLARKIEALAEDRRGLRVVARVTHPTAAAPTTEASPPLPPDMCATVYLSPYV